MSPCTLLHTPHLLHVCQRAVFFSLQGQIKPGQKRKTLKMNCGIPVLPVHLRLAWRAEEGAICVSSPSSSLAVSWIFSVSSITHSFCPYATSFFSVSVMLLWAFFLTDLSSSNSSFWHIDSWFTIFQLQAHNTTHFVSSRLHFILPSDYTPHLLVYLLYTNTWICSCLVVQILIYFQI